MSAPGAFLSRQIPPAAAWLGGAGLLPFAGLALATMIVEDAALRELCLRAFVGWSALVLAFLGGVRWGAALGHGDWRRLSLATVPALLAFGCLLMTDTDALKVLALLYAVVGFFDVMRRPAPEWPAWFMKLRARLSGAVVVIHAVLLFVLNDPR